MSADADPEMKQVAVPDCRPEGIGGSTVLHPAKDSVNVCDPGSFY